MQRDCDNFKTLIRYLHKRFIDDKEYGKIEISSQNGKDFRIREINNYTILEVKEMLKNYNCTLTIE